MCQYWTRMKPMLSAPVSFWSSRDIMANLDGNNDNLYTRMGYLPHSDHIMCGSLGYTVPCIYVCHPYLLPQYFFLVHMYPRKIPNPNIYTLEGLDLLVHFQIHTIYLKRQFRYTFVWRGILSFVLVNINVTKLLCSPDIEAWGCLLKKAITILIYISMDPNVKFIIVIHWHTSVKWMNDIK